MILGKSGPTIAVTVAEKPLVCLVCGNDRFRERDSRMPSGSGFALFDAHTTTYICAKCGFVFSFMERAEF